MKFVLILSIGIYFYYLFIVKGNGKNKMDYENINIASLLKLERMFYFSSTTSFFIWLIFQLEIFFWIAIYSIPVLFAFIPKSKLKKNILILLILTLYLIRVPINSYSFIEYINEMNMFQCINEHECIKLDYIVTDDNLSKIKVEYPEVSQYSFNWYLVYSKGFIRFEYQDNVVESITAVNFGGIWIKIH